MPERKPRTPSLTTLVRRALEGECALPRGSAVMVAVSGGPDSMALLSALTRLAPRFDLSLLAHGVDHGLRPAASAELDLAESFAQRAGVRFERTCVTVSRGGNLQARARDLRFRALVEAARRHRAALAVAHHAADRAETMLIRLLRGSGLRGLAVLPPKTTAPGADDVLLIRPLLRAQRSDVETHLARHDVPFAIDPSNDDARYVRTRVRQDVLPILRELDPSVVRHLEALADELVTTVPVDDAGPSVQHRASGAPAWAAALPRPTQAALAALLREGSPKARVWLPGGLVVSLEQRPLPKVKPSG